MKRSAIYNREEITCILGKGDADDTDTRNHSRCRWHIHR